MNHLVAQLAAGRKAGCSTNVKSLKVRICGTVIRTFSGRFAWTLHRLIEAGERGCTPLEQPAPRWSHYVFWLRRQGINIQTITEQHGGPYAGNHARYVLRSHVEMIEMREAA